MNKLYLQSLIGRIFVCVLGIAGGLFVPILLPAQIVPTPTQTGTIIVDNGTPGKADPNDRIRYKVTIQNTGVGSATGVQLNAVPDAKTTLVGGSFRTSPLALDDAYACTGNVGLTVPAPSGLKSNDYDDTPAGLTCVAGTFTTTGGGSITLAADGSFAYTPAAGFTGTDTYTYTLNDGNAASGVAATDQAVVRFTISNMIWFVDNTGGGSGGTGTLADPFKTISAFNASSGPQAGQVVFIKETGTNYPGSLSLKATQYLYGTGRTGGANLADIGVLPFTVALNSPILPAINGTKPIIAAASGAAITLASGNTVRGVATSGGANGIVGNAVAGLTMSETNVSAATAEGVKLTNPTGTVSITSNTISATGNAVTTTANGTVSVDLSSNTLTSGAVGASIDGTGGTMTITGFANNTVSGNTTATGISITAARFDATAGGGFNTVSGGTMIIGQSGNGVDGSGLLLNSVTGDLSFTDLDIYTDAGTGLWASSTGVFNAAGSTGFRIVVGASVATIEATGGPAVDLTNATIDLQLSSLKSTNSTTTGTSLVGIAGTFSAPSGSTITNATGTDINIDGGTATITYNGTITDDVGQLISIANTTGGTKSFTGAITDGDDGDGSGISLSSNTNATISFTGGVTLSTGANAAFAAIGGGTVTVTGSTNRITTTSGTALNVANTTIGAGGLNFLSISANGASNGIILNATGSGAGLSVTGTGSTDASGGTIQNITNRGVSATNTAALSLKNMRFTNANTTDGGGPCGAADNSGCNAAIHLNTVTTATLDNVDINGTAEQGINAREVSAFTLTGSTLINCGTASSGADTEESCLYAINLSGTCSITNSSLTVPSERAAVIYNTSKTMALTVNGSTFGMNQTQALGADGLEIDSYGASNTTINIVNSTFVQPKTNGLQVITEGTSTSSMNITGSTFDPGAGLAAAIDMVVNNTAEMDFNIINNPSIKGKGINVVNLFAFPNATFEGRINNNTVMNNGGSGAGIRVVSQGNGNSKVEIKNNAVTGADDYGITVNSQAGSGQLDATVTGNTVSVSSGGFYAIHALAGATGSTFTNKICANVAGNTTTATGGAIGNFQARAATAGHQILLQGGGNTVGTNWSANINTPVPGITSQSGAGTFTFGAACSTPANPGI